MKAGVYYNNKDLRIEEIALPDPGPGEILIKVMACGICGSDVLEWYRKKKAPLVLGHELTGKIVKLGKDVSKFKVGDRVFSTHHVPCGGCRYCLNGNETACEIFQTKNNFYPGGFAEYVKVSGKSVDSGTFILPEKLSYEEGSFIEPLGTVVRGLRAIGIKPGNSLLVLGAGIAGLLFIKAARALGAGRIIATDINDFRLEAAKKFGAEFVFRADKDIPALLMDKVIISTGALSAAAQGLKSVDKGGTVLFFAVPKPGETIPIDFNPYWREDISIKTCYGAAPLDNLQAIELLRAGNIRVDDMITHRLNLEKIGEGFRLAAEGKECLKVIIRTFR